MLEYDVVLDTNFEKNLTIHCKSNQYDVISFIPINYFFNLDIKENILKHFLTTKNISFERPNIWYATTNHCLKLEVLASFVNWYYPSCKEISKLDPIKISWYHERIFSLYILNYKFKLKEMKGLTHNNSNSHENLHSNINDISNHLVDLYINVV